MAVAEARAVWQRTANRCFVQEDAKRAPKLACCQSSSSSSKQVDGGPNSAVDVTDHPTLGFMPLNRNPSFSRLPPDTRWWLQLQPGYGYQKGLTSEQLNALEAEMESLRAGNLDSLCKGSDPQEDRYSTCFDGNKIDESYFCMHCKNSTDCMSRDPEVKKQELNPLDNKSAHEFCETLDTRENSESVEMETIGCPKMQKSNEDCFDPESPWISGGKNLPWWRTDKDDLASLVAQKSLDYIENCDLPPPQKVQMRRYPSAHSGSSDHDDTLISSLDWKARSDHVSSPIVHAQECSDFKSVGAGDRASIEGHSLSSSDNSLSYTKTHKDVTLGQDSESDPCKAQLLEALRHSQTRAREAERAAKQACAEKDHVIKLFFRQASQLFAYKQWFQMLQLEALYNQMKNGDQPMSTLFPVALPWMPQKGKRLRKSWQKSSKGKRGKRGRPRHDIGKYAVAFALGLSLVGAGLLLGWTVGWMLPF